MDHRHKEQPFVLLATNGCRPLAERIATKLGVELGAVTVGVFENGETKIQIRTSVRGKHVFVIGSIAPPRVNDRFMEMVLVCQASDLAHAEKVTAVVPHFGYARQDRRTGYPEYRTPISAAMVAEMLTLKATSVITVELHATQIQGFFKCPTDNLHAGSIALDYFRKREFLAPVTFVSPDIGGAERARAIAKRFMPDGSTPIAILDKRRPAPGLAEILHVIGDVEGRSCVILDDMVDTAGTLVLGAEAIKNKGAVETLAYCVHPIFSGPAIARIKESSLSEIVVTDTIDLSSEAQACKKVKVLSVDDYVAKAIQRTLNGESFDELACR